MAKLPALRVVTAADTDFLDLIDEEIEVTNMMFRDEDARSLAPDLEDALGELRSNIEDAVDFMQTTILPKWERAQEFFDGESDVKKIKNRSEATKTVVRDTIRALKPNIMRVFTQYPEIIAYEAANTMDFAAAAIAQAQTSYVNQLFWSSGGYITLANGAHNTLLKNVGVMKAHYSLSRKDEYVRLTSVSADQFASLQQMQGVQVLSVEEMEGTGLPDAAGVVTPLLLVELAWRREAGEIALEDVLLHEFFVDEGATCAEDAAVIGQRRSATVGYARSIGLDYDGDWLDLDDHDAELNEASGEAETRRGYAKKGTVNAPADESRHKFLLTEVYAEFDLDGTGIAQLYRFWLGGTGYEYLAHERVEENPYGVICADPIPGSFFGSSLYDVLLEDQNTQTSLLRATLDNAHLANNRRLAFHDTLVNQQDVMNPAIGAPIRFRQPGMIQEIGTESTLGTMLPLMQYLETGSQNKVGVTNASMGLDPDALQSTDKEAVRNTIQLAQGQVELVCRNIAETGLRAVFTKLLRLSLRHKPREQVIFANGYPVPVDQAIFKPEMRMKVSVGMGTGSADMRIAALQLILPQQQQIVGTYGLNNPICSITHVMNTIVDLGSLMGLPNMGRYFNQITPETAAQLDAYMKEQAAAAQPEPPSAAIAIAEQIRGQTAVQVKTMEIERDREKQSLDAAQDSAKLLTDDDFRRDKLEQDYVIARMRWLGEQIRDANMADEKERDRAANMQRELLNLATTISNRTQERPDGSDGSDGQPQNR